MDDETEEEEMDPLGPFRGAWFGLPYAIAFWLGVAFLVAPKWVVSLVRAVIGG